MHCTGTPSNPGVIRRWFIALLLTAGIGPVVAGELTVTVLDTERQATANIVVFATPLDREAPPPQPNHVAIMDQVNKRFVPHILVIQRDTLVKFPNSDTIKHHVYSFSAIKTFELKLYSGEPPDPLLFEQAGIATLGCNIHDNMLGYIVVVDTPWFGKTRRDGAVTLNLPDGNYRINIWNPRLRPEDIGEDHTVMIEGKTVLDLNLQKPIRPSLRKFDDVDEFEEY